MGCEAETECGPADHMLRADRAGGETLNPGFKEPSARYKKKQILMYLLFLITVRKMGLEPTRSQ